MYCLSSFCFICLSKRKGLEKLIDCDESKSYYDKLFVCIPQMDFEKIRDEALVCKECMKQIDQMYSFREVCLKNNETLRGYFLKLTSKDDNDGGINAEISDMDDDDVEIIDLGNGIVLERNNSDKNQNIEESQTAPDEPPAVEDIEMNENLTASEEIDESQIDAQPTNRVEIHEEPETTELPKPSDYRNENVSIILKNLKIDQSQIRLMTPNIVNNHHVPVIFKKLNVSHIGINSSNDVALVNETSDHRTESPNDLDLINDITINNPNVSITKTKKPFKPQTSNKNDEVEFVSISKDPDDDVEFVSITNSSSDVEFVSITNNDVEFVSMSNNQVSLLKSNSILKSSKESKNGRVNNQFQSIRIERINTDDYFEPETMDVGDRETGTGKRNNSSTNNQGMNKSLRTNYSCSICNKTFTNVEEFQTHFDKHNKSASEQHDDQPVSSSIAFNALIDTVLTCKICLVTFSDSDTLSDHLQLHKNNRVYKCTICHEIFNKLRLLKQHKAVHVNKNYTCDICNKLFLNLEEFEEHKIKHISEGPYKCVFCTKTYIKLQDLKAHESTHTNERYTCETCNRCFYKLQQLEDHKIMHTGVRPYVCEICNKSFQQISNLKIHRLIHTGERPHVCDVCNKAFIQISHLKSHKLVHTNERPYVCDICHKSYQQSCYLKVHKLAHTGEKPHTCKGCGRAYTRASYVRKHQNNTKCLIKLKESKKADPLYIP